MKYQGQTFYVVSLNDLIKSKRAAGRDIDLEDVRLLELPEHETNELMELLIYAVLQRFSKLTLKEVKKM